MWSHRPHDLSPPPSPVAVSLPEPRDLGSGVSMLPIPLPLRSPAWVNVYIVEAGEGLLMLDCGAAWVEGRMSIADAFDGLGLDENDVHTLVVTHLHPDHVALSSQLMEELGCRFVMHEHATRLVDRYNDTNGALDRLVQVAQRHGVPDSLLQAAADLGRPDWYATIQYPDHTVADGDHIDLGAGRFLEVVHTPGHEQSHISLRDSLTGVFFTGDHVLPRISPVIMYEETLDDVLGDYLTSLKKLLDLGIGVSYPAHGTLIDRGDERVRQILLHHDRRLLDMAELVREGKNSAWQVMRESFRPNLDPVSARLAFLETIAHLEHLASNGRVQVEERDGRVVYLA